MSQLQVDTILNTNGDGAPDFPHGMTVTGVVTATTLNQNVSGIITAQSLSIGDNIQFGNAGIITATGFAGDGANLTNLPPAGGVVVGVSSGSITGGKGVVVAGDGKLMAASGSNEVFGTNTLTPATNSGGFAATYDTTANKHVLFYRSGADSKGYAVVGTLSGTTITWGTPVEAFDNGPVQIYSATYDPHNNKVAVLYSDDDDGNKGKVQVGTVSGTTFTKHTPVDVFGGHIASGWITYCANSDHNYAAVATYQYSPYDAVARIGQYSTSSGGSTNWPNSAVNYDASSRAFATTCCWDSTANKLVIAYGRYNSTERGTIIAGTIASDAVTFGTSQVFDSSRTDRLDNVIHNPDTGKNMIVWCEGSNGTGYYTLAREATLSGTTFTFGTESNVSRNADGTLTRTNMCSVVYDTAAKKFMIIYADNVTGVTEGYSAILDISSSGVISSKGWHGFRPGIDNMGDENPHMVYDPDAGKVVAYTYGSSKCYYYVQGLRESNMTDNNYVGLSQASYTDGQSAKVDVTGATNEAVSGLSPANKYYVLADGTLSTTADSESITAGVAVAANKLLLRNPN